MKICIVGSSKLFFSGISAYTIVMSNAFNQKGHQTSSILLRRLVPLFLYPGKSHIGQKNDVLDFERQIPIYDGMDWYSPISWVAALRFLRHQKPDAIIMHWWTSSVAHMQILLGLFRLLLSKRPVLILEMHEVVDPLEEKILPIRWYSRIAGRLLLKLCDLYTAHSEEARQKIISTYHISDHRIYMVPHGPYNYYNNIDRETARSELGLMGFVILYFGMIRQYKGVPMLFKAFDMLPESIARESRLVIAGEDWHDDAELEPALRDSKYKDRISIIPQFIPDETVPKYFAAADVVVLPYTRSCGSGVASIAAAQGKSIIMSDLATLKESFMGYQGASFFPARDQNALKDRLKESYNRWQAEGTTSYHYIDNTWESIICSYENMINNFMINNINRKDNYYAHDQFIRTDGV